MLVSHQARCIFVHIQKTGGSSVEAILRAHLPDLRQLGHKHDHAAWQRDALPQWEDYFKFAFVRNPWDRLVSWHAMMWRKKPYTWWQRLQGRRRNRMWRYVRSQGQTFETFVRQCTAVVDDYDGRKCFAWNQLDYVTDKDGALLVDFVGRFEHFAADLRTIVARLGVDDPALPHVNASPHRHYTDYYTPALADLVAQRYARDIGAFGYRFEATPPVPQATAVAGSAA